MQQEDGTAAIPWLTPRILQRTLAAGLALLLAAGCSTTHQVRTKPARELLQELRASSDAVEEAALTFTRPALRCSIRMEREPSPKELEEILKQLQAFATEENMQEAAASAGWSDVIWDFQLSIDTDGDLSAPEHEYWARYYKGTDHTDDSPDNIDAYRSWLKITRLPSTQELILEDDPDG